MKLKLVIITILITLQIFVASALTVKNFEVSPSQIEPGKEAEITIDVENNLGMDLENVIVSLDLSEVPFAPYKSGSEKVIEEIDEEDTETVRFKVLALSDAESGTYKIPVEIEGGNETKKSFISLSVNAKPILEIDYEGILIRGTDNELTIKIINSGLSGVKLLSLDVEGVSGLNFFDSTHVYLGDIDSDDFDSASFKVYVSEDAGTINLPVKIKYRDSLNKIYEETKILSLKTYTRKEAISLGLIKKSNSLTIIGGILGLIILYVAYRKIRKRLRERKAEKGR